MTDEVKIEMIKNITNVVIFMPAMLAMLGAFAWFIKDMMRDDK